MFHHPLILEVFIRLYVAVFKNIEHVQVSAFLH